jgi:hypothetical protein
VNSFDTTRGIIAILTCPAEENGQSFTVEGPAQFRNENGSFVQMNRCNDPGAPTMHIAQADADVAATALLVSGPNSERPLVELNSEESLLPVDSPAAVFEINTVFIPTLPMIRPVGMQVIGHDAQTDFYADGLEIENEFLGTHTCLNSIELLVRCGGDAEPAGISMDPATGETRVNAEQINGTSGSFSELFSHDIATFNLVEIMGTDGPF